MLEGFYGVLQLGAVFVPMNTRLEPEDYVYILNHSESMVLYIDKTFSDAILPVKDKLMTVETIISNEQFDKDGVILYEDMLAYQQEDDFDYDHMYENDLAIFLYT